MRRQLFGECIRAQFGCLKTSAQDIQGTAMRFVGTMCPGNKRATRMKSGTPGMNFLVAQWNDLAHETNHIRAEPNRAWILQLRQLSRSLSEEK